MDFGLSEDQVLLEQTVRSFLADQMPIERVRKLRDQYPTLPTSSPSADNTFDPVETINRLLAWTHTATAHRPARLKAARSLSKRLRRIRTDLSSLLDDS